MWTVEQKKRYIYKAKQCESEIPKEDGKQD
jgi:hypothetical protein